MVGGVEDMRGVGILNIGLVTGGSVVDGSARR